MVRERLPGDPPSEGVLIIDLEGELFFGAAPDLAQHLGAAAARAKLQGIDYLVLRLKRVRNPDVVALEQFENFLRDARAGGLTVLLAGVRADLLDACRRVGIMRHVNAELVFPEEKEEHSATLKAIRAAYGLQAHQKSDFTEERASGAAYYLV